jgi:DUF1009 family protein
MTLAIIAGNGDLPKLIIKECQKEKRDFVIILVEGNSNHDDYKGYNSHIVGIGHVSKALAILKENKAKEIVFAGGINKPSFSNIKVDKKGAILLSKLVANKIFGDNNTLTTITNFFTKEGFKIVGADNIIKDIVAKKGVLTSIKPSKMDLDNIKIGQNALELMSDLDVGQAIAVQQKQIIAIEAAEVTDELIKRCNNLQFKTGEKPVLIKIKKKNQSTKVDLPTIGEKTILNLAKANFSGIALKSGSTLILDQSKVISAANKNKIFISVI